MSAAKDSRNWGFSAQRNDARRIGLAAVCGPLDRHPVTGKTWQQMPGQDEIFRKMNFFLHRRGFPVGKDDE